MKTHFLSEFDMIEKGSADAKKTSPETTEIYASSSS